MVAVRRDWAAETGVRLDARGEEAEGAMDQGCVLLVVGVLCFSGFSGGEIRYRDLLDGSSISPSPSTAILW